MLKKILKTILVFLFWIYGTWQVWKGTKVPIPFIGIFIRIMLAILAFVIVPVSWFFGFKAVWLSK